MPTRMPTSMMMMDDGMDMNMDMTMVMTFSDWSTYQLKILFDSWNVTKRWQFALSCLCIIVVTIFYQWIKVFMAKLEARMKAAAEEASYFESDNIQSGIYMSSANTKSVTVISSSKVPVLLRVYHALASAFNYGVSLSSYLFFVASLSCL